MSLAARVAGLAVCAMAADARAQETFVPGLRWDWQLTEPLDLGRSLDVMDLHPELVTRDDVATLRARGVRTICYVSVGTVERTSPDGELFPAEVIGRTYADWPDEKFLDTRRLDILVPLMSARFERCKALGFDAIEPDNMDGHDNDTGFDISPDDSVAYVMALADEAHRLGLAIAQKNLPELTSLLAGTLDFAVTESCFQDGWCDEVGAYVRAGKAVFDAEYVDEPLDFEAACRHAAERRITMIAKDRDLTRQLRACPN